LLQGLGDFMVKGLNETILREVTVTGYELRLPQTRISYFTFLT